MAVTIGVPRETFPGERRVALTPRASKALAKLGASVIIEESAGVEAGFPDQSIRCQAARVDYQPRRRFRAVRHCCASARAGRQSRRPAAPDLRLLRAGPNPDRLRRAADGGAGNRGTGARRRVVLRHGADAAHHARAEHGRALVHGHHRRVPRRAARRHHAAQNVPHADDRRGNRHGGARFGAGRGRRRPAGHRHRAASGRGGLRLRRPQRGEGTDREPGRQIRGAGYRGRRRRRTRAVTPRPWTKTSTAASASCSPR